MIRPAPDVHDALNTHGTPRHGAPGLFTAAATFEAIGTHHRLVATRPETIGDAVVIARDHLRELDLAVSRFRSDSEVSDLARRALRGPASVVISWVFASSLQAALRAARLTDGLVDPTVGRAMLASGYDADLAVVQCRDAEPQALAAVPGWRRILLDLPTRRLSVPQGMVIDLGASAKAQAADTIAARLADRLPGGFLVSLGGDVAVSGTVPAEGWQVAVEGTDGECRQVVASTGQALATSSTARRTWTQGGQRRHHILDPRTSRPAEPVWEQVTCAAASALEANAASTAAVVLGAAAPGWLEARGIPARLDPATPGPAVTTTGWPKPPGERSAA
jgi:thiamine biosynthesis lipoprotein